MLFRYFYDGGLAHASYLVGCEHARVAIIIDPDRDVDKYLIAAEQEDLEITSVAETHIPAEYVSGAKELAGRLGATLYVSGEGAQGTGYKYLAAYAREVLRNGSAFHIGSVLFKVIHTPGHTPESLSFLVIDEGAGANRPVGIFTGDFILVGSIGRPEIIEDSPVEHDFADQQARKIFQSAKRFKDLPAYLQVWPSRDAGSVCGKAIRKIPSSTVGYEKIFNPALQFTDEEAFVQYILADQPEMASHCVTIKEMNKAGPGFLGNEAIKRIDASELKNAVLDGTVVDLAPSSRFTEGHYPGAINIPLNQLATWAGWLLSCSLPVFLIGDDRQRSEAVRILHNVGFDNIGGGCGQDEIQRLGIANEAYLVETPSDLASRINSRQVSLIDVRSDAEWRQSHICHAEHIHLGQLPNQMDKISNDKPVVVYSRTGTRSAIASSLFQASGYRVINMHGGYRAWKQADLPVADGERSGTSRMEKETSGRTYS
ncbi:MBL fold metallo-hydrolase [bacterium]|nr:MBL fold metallo-hydrolase [bacterium]